MTSEPDAISEAQQATDEPTENLRHFIKTDTELFWRGVHAGWTPDFDLALRIPSENVQFELEQAMFHAGTCALYVGTWPAASDA